MNGNYPNISSRVVLCFRLILVKEKMGSHKIICSVLFAFCYISLQGFAESRSQKVKSGNSTYFVIISDSGEEKFCKCIDFLQCDQANSCDIDDRPDACPAGHSCCISEAPPGYDGTSTGITTEKSSPCTCALKTECAIEIRTVSSWGCKDNEVCCSEIIKEPNSTFTEYDCGRRKSYSDFSRISNPGPTTRTYFGQFPFMASVWNQNGSFICGASLIWKNMLLTAAQCVSGRHIETLKVRVADYDITNQTAEETSPFREQNVSAIEIHPDFIVQGNWIANDLAVLVTVEPFPYDNNISPVCSVLYGFKKYAGPEAYNEHDCVAIGWGKSSPSLTEDLSAVLKKTDLSLVDFDECQEKLRKEPTLGSSFELSPSFLCAGGVNGYDTCVSDGGGPLLCPMLSEPDQYVQVGVTSWGVGCSGKFPGLYSSLEANHRWISLVHKRHSPPSDGARASSKSQPVILTV